MLTCSTTMRGNGIQICPRRDTLENWVKHNVILKDREIAVIDMPDGTSKVVLGDGINKTADCKEFNLFFDTIEIKGDNIFLINNSTAEVKDEQNKNK